MARVNEVAKKARIVAYKDTLNVKLASHIIDCSKPEFADLMADRDPKKPMSSLNGAIILERDLREDGGLKGVVSVGVDDLAAILPDIKKDTQDKMGWKKWRDLFLAEGLPDILDGVVDPVASEYELTALEELATVDPDSISDFDAKQKLKEIKAKL